MDVRAALRPSTRRTWVLGLLGVGAWTVVVSLLAGAYVVELTSESVPAVGQWYDVGDGLAVMTLLAALAVTTSLRSRGARPLSTLLAAPVLVLLPQVVLAGEVARAWRAEAPELRLVGDGVPATIPSTAVVPAGLDAYAAAVGAGCLRLLPLVALVTALGWLAGRLGARGGVLVAATWVTVLVATTEVSALPSYAATRPDSGVRTALQVIVSGEPERLVPQVEVGCHPLVGPVCGEVMGLGTAYPFPAAAVVVLAALAGAWSRAVDAATGATVRQVRRRGPVPPSTSTDDGDPRTART